MDLPDSSTNNGGARHLPGPSAQNVAPPSGGGVNDNEAPEDAEVADLMSMDAPGPSGAGNVDVAGAAPEEPLTDPKSAFEDAKRKLRLVLSTADFQIFPHPPFSGVGEPTHSSLNVSMTPVSPRSNILKCDCVWFERSSV